jgi:hypothetical protein
MKNIKYIMMGALAIMLFSCDLNTDLDVNNLESPASTDLGIESTADGLFQSWFVAVNNYDSPGLALATMSDNVSCSWGNQGMRDMSSEPRIAWDNSSTYTYSAITEVYFNSMYSILSDANGIVTIIEEGNTGFSDDDLVESLARFGQAATIGSLAQVFDKVYIFDETGTLNEGLGYPFDEAMQIALEKLDLAIEAADRGDFEVTQVNGLTLTSSEWSQFLNSFGARLLATSARNSTQRAALDWTRILNYSNNGLTYDLNVLSDGFETWFSEWVYYANISGWTATDLYAINLMDTDYPDYWPEDATTLDPASSDDQRLLTDFTYEPAQWMIASRGTYHYSSYSYARYDDWQDSNFTTSQTEYLQAENELYKAEALMRLGDVDGAATVINASSRVLRGGLDLVDANEEDVAEAIHYERVIELMNTGMGLAFYEMRGLDLLQEGTPLHFPVPGAALDANGEENYTFGGTTGEAGVDYSNGGWR